MSRCRQVCAVAALLGLAVITGGVSTEQVTLEWTAARFNDHIRGGFAQRSVFFAAGDESGPFVVTAPVAGIEVIDRWATDLPSPVHRRKRSPSRRSEST